MKIPRKRAAGAMIAAVIVSAPVFASERAEPNASAALQKIGHYAHTAHQGHGNWGSVYGSHASTATVSLWHAIYTLDLSADQRRDIDVITAELHAHLQDFQLRRHEAASELPSLYAANEPDPKAIGAVYAELFDAKRQRIEAVIDAKNGLLGALTDEQRARLERAEDNAEPSYDS